MFSKYQIILMTLGCVLLLATNAHAKPPASAVKAAIEHQKSELHRCYVDHVPASDRVEHGNNADLEIRVDYSGRAQVLFKNTTLTHAAARECMLGVLRRTTMPATGELWDVEIYLGMDSEMSKWVVRVAESGATTQDMLEVVNQNLGQLVACFEERRKEKPGLKGGVELVLTISTSGRVQKAELAKNSVPDPEVGRCVLKKVKSLEFPRPASLAILRVPIEFSAE